MVFTYIVVLIPDMTGTSDSAMSRRKSLKKSLRESFRRLRKGRSQRRRQEQAKPKTYVNCSVFAALEMSNQM